jgi:2'-5' RNA ligase
MSDAIRTFVCLEIPASVRERMEKLQGSLRSIDARISWVKKENIHLTLKFLGDVEPNRLNAVCEAVGSAALSINPFKIEVSGAGCFPSSHRPRVLWVGIARLSDDLKRLHAGIEKNLARCGFARDDNKFSPHLTIGRVRSPKNASQVAERLIAGGFEAESFTTREVIVMRSELSAGGSIYTPQAVIRLGSQSQTESGVANHPLDGAG